jgi:hypothetical protein
VPTGANGLERLTWVPGVVGNIAEFVVGAAIRPNRMMALAVGPWRGWHADRPEDRGAEE